MFSAAEIPKPAAQDLMASIAEWIASKAGPAALGGSFAVLALKHEEMKDDKNLE